MTSSDQISKLHQEISNHPSNRLYTKQGYAPLFSVHPEAKIVIIGQAPGKQAQESNMVWNDKSGDTLMKWLGVEERVFRDPAVFAHLPMDFYYPGKGVSGDLPPRKDFAPLWHPKALEMIPKRKLILLVGNYAQTFYLRTNKKVNLTETVKHYQEYLPAYFPLVHPSPLNFRWHAQNPWFMQSVVPVLQRTVSRLLNLRRENDLV